MRRQVRPGADAEGGAVAVEFALLLPILLMILMAIIEFGYYFFVQASVAGAAREAVRSYAINYTVAGAKTTATAIAAAAVPDSSKLVSVTYVDCTVGGQTTATVVYRYHSLTGALDFAVTSTPTVVGIGTMRCAG